MMREKRIRHLPVIDSQGRINSMLSSHDMTDVPKFRDLPVELFASFPVRTVKPDTPLSLVALTMLEEKISSLIVVENNEAIGIITSDDLLFQFSLILKDKEKSGGSYNWANVATTAGEFFRKLADIGI
ncbi:MAG: CBS domain-containing protein [Bdellovibrionota bacterium]